MQESFGLLMRRQIFFWSGVFFLFLAFLWLFSDILLPFIAGMILAYALDPVADRLEAMGTSRLVATIIILLVFLLVFILTLMVVIPILANQITGFLERMPAWVSQLQALIASSDSEWLKNRFGIDQATFRDNMDQILTQGAGWLSSLLSGVWSSGKSLLDVISLLVVTPVVAFYILYDWDHMVKRIDESLPRDHKEDISQIFRDVNSAVAGFVRGQGSVCLALGIFYAVSLTALGLNFGLLIGLFAGLISFIPFVGSIVGFVLSVSVALVQFWPEWIPIFMTAAIFAAGQFFEGNFLQPKLVGDRVGLHPVWLMFALFAFGSMFGFTGMLIAVPAAAAVGVVVRFMFGKYLQSELYRGSAKPKAESATTRSRRATKPTK